MTPSRPGWLPVPIPPLKMVDMSRLMFVVMIVGVSLVACEGSARGPEGARVPDDPLLEHADTECEDQDAVAADPGARGEGTVQAELVASASTAEVWIATDPDGERGCEAFLVAGIEDEIFSVPLGAEDPAPFTPPQVTGAAEIDGRPGAEVIVQMLTGASTAFYAIFSAGGGELERLTVDGGPFGDLFPSGGGAAQAHASDCSAGGRVVISSALSDGDSVRIERLEFAFEKDGFDRIDRVRDEVEPVALADVAPEFDGTPFGGCPPS